jgi:hypothetical protein
MREAKELIAAVQEWKIRVAHGQKEHFVFLERMGGM